MYSVFARSDFLRIFGVPNESRRHIITYYMFKYSFRIKKTLLESLRWGKILYRLGLSKTSYKDIVFARGEFLTLVGGRNESLRLIKIYYMF